MSAYKVTSDQVRTSSLKHPVGNIKSGTSSLQALEVEEAHNSEIRVRLEWNDQFSNPISDFSCKELPFQLLTRFSSETMFQMPFESKHSETIAENNCRCVTVSLTKLYKLQVQSPIDLQATASPNLEPVTWTA